MTAAIVILALALLAAVLEIAYASVRYLHVVDERGDAREGWKDATRNLGTEEARSAQLMARVKALEAQVVTLSARLRLAQARLVGDMSDEELIDEINHPGAGDDAGDDRDKLLPFPRDRAAGAEPATPAGGVPGGRPA